MPHADSRKSLQRRSTAARLVQASNFVGCRIRGDVDMEVPGLDEKSDFSRKSNTNKTHYERERERQRMKISRRKYGGTYK